MGKNTSFVLGLIGGILGFITAFFGFFLSIFASSIRSSVPWIFVFSTIGIIGSVIVRSKPKIGGIIMLISGLVIVIFSSLFGLLPMILLVLGGILGITYKERKK